MFQSNKAQISLEFIVLIAILILLSFFFVSSLYKTFDSTYSIHKIKNRTLEVLSMHDSGIIISRINSTITDNNISLNVVLKVGGPSDYVPTIEDYNIQIKDIKNKTVFENVTLSITLN